MVQIVENWTDVVGTVRAITTRDDVMNDATLWLVVDAVHDVEGSPNLLAATPGELLEVATPRASLDDAGVVSGTQVKARVRRAGPGRVFAPPAAVQLL